MTRLADRLLSRFVPSTTASAAVQKKCIVCTGTRSKLCFRECFPQTGCEPWSCGSCGTC